MKKLRRIRGRDVEREFARPREGIIVAARIRFQRDEEGISKDSTLVRAGAGVTGLNFTVRRP